MLGKKNLTRDGPMFSRRSRIERRNANRATQKRSGEAAIQKDYGLSFYRRLVFLGRLFRGFRWSLFLHLLLLPEFGLLGVVLFLELLELLLVLLIELLLRRVVRGLLCQSGLVLLLLLFHLLAFQVLLRPQILELLLMLLVELRIRVRGGHRLRVVGQ